MAYVILGIIALLVLGAVSYTYGALLIPVALAAWWQRDYLKTVRSGANSTPTMGGAVGWLTAIAATTVAAVVIGVATHQSAERHDSPSDDVGQVSTYVPQYWQDECARLYKHEAGSGDVGIFDKTNYDDCISEHTVEGDGEAGTYTPGDVSACADYDDPGDFAACMDGSIEP